MEGRSRRTRSGWLAALQIVALACLSTGQQADIQNLVTSGNLEGMRWPSFSDYRNWLQKFYEPNALGLIKLIFPNEHNVYLHSTPSQSFFSRSRRDFSHGCIRVEKPAELAAWALRNNPDWTLQRVQQGMMSGNDDVTVNLARRVPVFIVYGTALAHEDGEVHFSDDIYGHDAKLATALAKGYPYP